MKKIIALILFGLLFSCKAQKNVSSTMPKLSSECPQDGTCTITVFTNEKLEILTDETGAIYYKKIADTNSTIFHFQYTRTVEEGIQDGHYQEEVIFEYSNENLPLNLTDQSLQKTKMLFGRHCFCKGQAGYFLVNSGSLNLEQYKGKTIIDVQFKISEIPQIITQIKGSL